MDEQKDIIGYCVYCKEAVEHGQNWCLDEDDNLHHSKCYVLLNNEELEV